MKVQSGLDFQFDFRVSSIISVLYVVFTYSIATPILYPISLAILFVFYWKDKVFLLANFYKKPGQYDGNLSKSVDDLLLLVILLHFVGGLLQV